MQSVGVEVVSVSGTNELTKQPTLTERLSAFNRKERYWLVRNALGDPDREMHLSEEFRQEINSKTGLSVPNDAWWAIDYHVDWIIGALAYYANGGDKHQIYTNAPTGEASQGRMICGTQEDFDLVIAFSSTVILVEAKFASDWSSEQLKSKIARLHSLAEMAVPNAFFGEGEKSVKSILH